MRRNAFFLNIFKNKTTWKQHPLYERGIFQQSKRLYLSS